MADTPTGAANADAEQLAALGYDTTFNREMTLWENFSLGFTYLSPVVGIYSLFALALAAGGPPMIFWLVIVGLGQLLVALVFSEVVSQYPIAGGVYYLRATKKVAGMRVLTPAWERRERRKRALAPAARAKEGLTTRERSGA